jgi:hypothetical protein
LPIVFRYVLLICGLLISVPLLVLFSLLPKTPISPVGSLYLVSYFLIVVGLIAALWRGNRSFVFILVGSTIVIVAIALRTLFPPSGTHINLIALPGPSGSRLLNRILDEQDVVLLGAQVPHISARFLPQKGNPSTLSSRKPSMQ